MTTLQAFAFQPKGSVMLPTRTQILAYRQEFQRYEAHFYRGAAFSFVGGVGDSSFSKLSIRSRR